MLSELFRDLKRAWDSLPWWLKALTVFFGFFLLIGYLSTRERPISQLLLCLVFAVICALLFPFVAAFYLFYFWLHMLCPHNALECFCVMLFFSMVIASEIIIFIAAYRRKQKMKRRKRMEESR